MSEPSSSSYYNGAKYLVSLCVRSGSSLHSLLSNGTSTSISDAGHLVSSQRQTCQHFDVGEMKDLVFKLRFRF